jgi:Uma2 family endonuclease
MSTAAVKRYSVDEYLALERASRDVKHEFFDGEIFAMAGASSPQNLIALNIASELRSALKTRDCLVHPSDMRVQCPTGLYTYPDVSVVCGKPQFADDRNDTLLNPLVIIEVLSPTTADYDRGGKFKNYQTIGSLREYALVEQDQPSIDHIARQNDGRWLITSLTGLDGGLSLPSLDLSVPMAEIYAKVDFPPEEELAAQRTMGEPRR